MKAVQVNAPGAEFEIIHKEIPQPGDNEVLIKVDACGICHGDIVAKEGHFPGIKYPITPGHEVVGVVEKVGLMVTSWKIGQRVGVGWHGGHCHQCSACRNGNFFACENSLTTGIHLDGGYAEFMIARPEVIVSIPDELSSINAAPLLCAGRTTFGALKLSGAQGGDLVAIHGLGGLGHLAVQYAVRLGFKTVVLSRGKDKEELAYKLGAHVYIDTDSGNAANQLIKLGGARVILCTAPNGKAISDLIPGLGRGGQAIIVTGARDLMQIPPMLLLGGERSVRGSVSGNIEETIKFSVLSKVIPMVEVFPLEQVALAFEKMMSSKVHFRSVLKMDHK
ncbi:MAG: alcohol dehydrogenase catalytic domain-containing protein [Ignavibacteriaceae bacterium]|nr:alcohol dehydrogenase catalytic domain-containing protein [Ignavibacteriaceae bacterium]